MRKEACHGFKEPNMENFEKGKTKGSQWRLLEGSKSCNNIENWEKIKKIDKKVQQDWKKASNQTS